jgi:hypothetical protein
VSSSRPKPGDGTPPPITTGNFVSWSGGKGRVDMVVSNGKVPGVDSDVEGSKKTPAARVVVYEKDGDTWKATSKRIAASTHTLKRIAPLTGGKSAPGGAATALVELMARHEERITYDQLDDSARVTGAAVKTVYERGLKAYPGSSTVLSREEWAEGRVAAFLAVAAGDEVPGYNRDLALLPKSHPKHPEHVGTEPQADDMVRVKQADLSGFEALLAE